MKRGDAGFGLLETVIALAILGIAVVVIAGGMGVSLAASNRHRAQAAGNALLLQAAENVKSSAVPHLFCAEPPGPSATRPATGYLTAARNIADPPRGWTATDITIESIEYYSGLGFSASPCLDSGDPNDPYRLALQLITLRIASPSGKDVEFISFVKGLS